MTAATALGSVVILPQFAEGRSPNPQTMAIRVQMGVLEPGRILQYESKHPVKTDVGDPDERKLKKHLVARRKRKASQCEGPTYVWMALYVIAPTRALAT